MDSGGKYPIFFSRKALDRSSGRKVEPGGGRDLLTGNKGPWLQLPQERCRLDIRKNSFVEKVIGHGKGLPGEVLESPSLEMSKECLEEAFSGLGDKSGICHKLDKVFSN